MALENMKTCPIKAMVTEIHWRQEKRNYIHDWYNWFHIYRRINKITSPMFEIHTISTGKKASISFLASVSLHGQYFRVSSSWSENSGAPLRLEDLLAAFQGHSDVGLVQ